MVRYSRMRMFFQGVADRITDRLLALTGSQRFLTAQLDITNACNLRCSHCYHSDHSNQGVLDMTGWRGVLDQYERLIGRLRLRPSFVICGGEPTLSPLFAPMLSELEGRWRGVPIVVLTNGAGLTNGTVSRLRRCNAQVQISLDGPDAERHDSIRGVGSFLRALEGLANLQRAGLNATLLATLSKRTSPWIKDFFGQARENGAAAMDFTRFISQGAGRMLEEGCVDRPLSAPELKEAYTTILRISRATGVPTNTNRPLYSLIEPALGASGKFGFQGIVIDYQGNLKVSSRADYRLGNVLEEGLERLFLYHPLMTDLRDGKIEACGSCPYYDRCGGDRNAAYASTGSFLAKDPACWLGNDS